MSDLDNTTPPRRIAITSGKIPNEDVGRWPAPYVAAVRLSRGAPVVLSPFTESRSDEAIPPSVEHREGLEAEGDSLSEDIAGLILTGGGDVDPALYSATPHPHTHNISRRRDSFERGIVSSQATLTYSAITNENRRESSLRRR